MTADEYKRMATESMAEDPFQAQVIDAARRMGHLVYHTASSMRSEPGFPDLVIAKPHRPLMVVEVKTEKGRVSSKQRVSRSGRVMPSQADWLATLAYCSPRIYIDVWRPSMWDEVLALLSGEREIRMRPE